MTPEQIKAEQLQSEQLQAAALQFAELTCPPGRRVYYVCPWFALTEPIDPAEREAQPGYGAVRKVANGDGPKAAAAQEALREGDRIMQEAGRRIAEVTARLDAWLAEHPGVTITRPDNWVRRHGFAAHGPDGAILAQKEDYTEMVNALVGAVKVPGKSRRRGHRVTLAQDDAAAQVTR